MAEKPIQRSVLPPTDSVISFLRRQDLKFIKELGQGACGQTVLLLDELIGEHFVCKKYLPYDEGQRSELFLNFVREIKLLHRVYHPNIVRIFNHYLYPDKQSGYILMEYVEGQNIADHIHSAPDNAEDIFVQAIAGFSHLEKRKILHRDIRATNILVGGDGILKIIDLGFGKGVQSKGDFDKSISVNLWCDPPREFRERKYDFCTEVYFVAKLFQTILDEEHIEKFQHRSLLDRMCQRDPKLRISSFFDVEKEIRNTKFNNIAFTSEELDAYREFADTICRQITKIDIGAKYRDDFELILAELESKYSSIMLERNAPDAAPILRCFLSGMYYYKKNGFPVSALQGFLQLLKNAHAEQKRVIFANLHTRFGNIARYNAAADISDDDIPF